ncbi:MAG TPA: winged helix-turn-helix domain-containing protein [Nitrososphaeraceae archaeon]
MLYLIYYLGYMYEPIIMGQELNFSLVNAIFTKIKTYHADTEMYREVGSKNQMKHRARTEVIVDILKYISSYGQAGGIQIPRIMYLCYVEHSRLRKFLTNLTEKKLLCYYEKTRRYKITQKGIKFLENYKQVGGLFNSSKTVG